MRVSSCKGYSGRELKDDVDYSGIKLKTRLLSLVKFKVAGMLSANK